MAPDLNSLGTAASSSATTSGHQQAQNNHHLATSQQPTTSSSRNSTSRSASNRSSPNHSRRTSQLSPMNPPPLPLGHHSNVSSAAHPHQQTQQTYAPFPPLSPNMSSASGAALNGRARTGSGAGPEMDTGVPMRHPRPLTAAELHHELELEQEAVVNRLTRELSALRAHSASVASTTSVSSMSTSASLQGSHAHLLPPASAGTPFPLFEATGDPLSTGAAHHAGALTGPTHPSGTASRRSRDRSSSSVSRSGASAAPPTLSHNVGGGAGPVAGAGLVGVHTGQQHHRYSISSPGGSSTSNSNNATSAPTSAATTGSTPGLDSSSASSSTYAGGVALARSPSLGVSGGGSFGGGHLSRFEETALHRQELEEAKRENELLRKRIRELETELRGRRRASTAASANGTAAAAASGENGGSADQETASRQSRPEAATVASADA
ncbi:hypothetical protein IWX90DRAFT_412999 [Phyllosticta citrichinensis]|uniref:Uncharacterized protein n=1 Tax=Phyllosticta citrichinensis TaxID=1130410 RepID=A0ABR1XZ46_9PEZI